MLVLLVIFMVATPMMTTGSVNGQSGTRRRASRTT